MLHLNFLRTHAPYLTEKEGEDDDTFHRSVLRERAWTGMMHRDLSITPKTHQVRREALVLTRQRMELRPNSVLLWP